MTGRLHLITAVTHVLNGQAQRLFAFICNILKLRRVGPITLGAISLVPAPAHSRSKVQFTDPAKTRTVVPFLPDTQARLALNLWSSGYTLPGGADEVLNLARPLALSSSSTLLLVGAGPSAGPLIATELRPYIEYYEANAEFASLATKQCKCLGNRAVVQSWQEEQPAFREAYHHGALVIEPLRRAKSGPFLEAVTRGLRAGGQLMLVDTVLVDKVQNHKAYGKWERLDGRTVPPPTAQVITQQLAHLGHDVRIQEDISTRHVALVLKGWVAFVQALECRALAPREATQVVNEVELWLLRLRLIQEGTLRLMHWHTTWHEA